MSGIPARIHKHLVRALSRCDPLKSHPALEALFVDERLISWRRRLPSTRAMSVSERVNALISYLDAAYNRRGENLLVLFLDVLKEDISPEDARRRELSDLAAQLGMLKTSHPPAEFTAMTPPRFGSPDDAQGNEFLKSLDFENIASINMFCHTGRSMVRDLLSKFEESERPDVLENIHVRILLRDPQSEVSSRADDIHQTVGKIMHLKQRGFTHLQYHFYQALPIFRGLVCKHKDGTQTTAFIGFYHFPRERTSKRLSYVFPIRSAPAQGEAALIRLFNSWFEHYWGKEKRSIQQIYGIIFDFDDTIVNSHTAQIEAWVEVVQKAQDKFPTLTPEHFSERIRRNLNHPRHLFLTLREMFFRLQSGTKILEEIFPALPPDVSASEIQTWRFEVREKKTYAQARLFYGFTNVIRKLAAHYHLAIISATDETMIEKYFANEAPSLLRNFPHVFGKREPVFDWETFERKSQLLLKIIGILGVPIERLVYVGDNHGDFNACQAVGIDFIEARLFAQELEESINRSSLIDSDEGRVFFTQWEAFPDALFEIEKIKRERD